MLDFADVVAINKFERRGAEDARRDVARQLVRNREAFGVAVGGHAGLRHQRRHASTTTASPRSTSTCAACSPSTGCRCAEGVLPAVAGRASRPALAPLIPPARVALPGRDRRDRARLPRARPAEQADGGAGRRQQLAAGSELRSPSDGAAPTAAAARSARRAAELLDVAPRTDAALALAELAGGRRARTRGDEQVVRVRDRELRTPLTPRDAVGQRRSRGSRCPGTPGPRRAAALPARGEPARAASRSPPGVFPFKRDGEDPARMFAGEGDAVPHQPALPAARRRAARRPGCRPRSTR